MRYERVTDFETSCYKHYKEQTIAGVKTPRKVIDRALSRTWVCAWGDASIDATEDSEVSTGRTIEQYLEHVRVLRDEIAAGDTLNIFTHNLSFDGAFVLYALLSSADAPAEIVKEDRDQDLYALTIRFKASGREVTFRDSHRIFPASVADIARLYGMQKEDGWDYEKVRTEQTEITTKEWSYVKRDVLIICKALKDYRDRGYTENTLASIAYAERLRETYPYFRQEFAKRRKQRNKDYRALYPIDIRPLDKEVAIEITPAYMGGWTWLSPRYYNVDLPHVLFLDENSGYPKQMAEEPLPVGTPEFFSDPTPEQIEQIEREYKCRIYVIENFSIELKRADSLPIAMFRTVNPAIRCQGKVIKCENERVVLSNVDYDLIKDAYDVKSAHIVEVFAFRHKTGQYARFVNKWMRKKAEATIARDEARERGDADAEQKANVEREIAKGMLVRTYGKDGTKLLRDKKTTTLENGVLTVKTELKECAIEFYLPSAIFVTAYQRRDTYRMAQALGSHYIYSDTDSAATDEEGFALANEAAERGEIKLDRTALGAWKVEKEGYDARFLRQKTYGYKDADGACHYVIAGATEDTKRAIAWDDFRPGVRVTVEQMQEKGLKPKLRSIAVPGGVILEETDWQIEAVETWDQQSGRNVPIGLFFQTMEELKNVTNNRT